MADVGVADLPAVGEGETARQAAELAAVQRMLAASRGCFSLSVAVCNSPALRDYLLRQIGQSLPGIHVAEIPADTVDVFGCVADGLNGSCPEALMLVNLEASIHSDQDRQPAIRALNAARELWEERFPCPIVVWLPEYAVVLLSLHAPDFWRYRSHRFEFVSEQATAAAGVDEFFLAGGFRAASALPEDEKRFRIAELEQRIAEAGEMPPKGLAPHVATWLVEAGALYGILGDTQSAEKALRKSLEIAERCNWSAGVEVAYAALSLMFAQRGDLELAEKMLLKATPKCEEPGADSAWAAAFGSLAMACVTSGDLDRAEEFARKAISVHERMGDQAGMANSYANLAIVYHRRGDLASAEEMTRRTMVIVEDLGRLGLTMDSSRLPLICKSSVDLHLARDFLRKSLAIRTKLGNPVEVSDDSVALADVCRLLGDFEQADELLRSALMIERRLGRAAQTALCVVRIGAIAAARGRIADARGFLTEARDLLRGVQNERLAQTVDSCLAALPDSATAGGASHPSV